MDPRTERMLAERRAAQASPQGRRLVRSASGWVSGYWRTVCAIVTIVIFAILVGHYLLVTLPARDRDRQLVAQREMGQQRAVQDLAGGAALETCLADADAAYATSWDASCGAIKRAAQCALPADRAQPLETARRQARETCVKAHAARPQ